MGVEAETPSKKSCSVVGDRQQRETRTWVEQCIFTSCVHVFSGPHRVGCNLLRASPGWGKSLQVFFCKLVLRSKTAPEGISEINTLEPRKRDRKHLRVCILMLHVPLGCAVAMRRAGLGSTLAAGVDKLPVP